MKEANTRRSTVIAATAVLSGLLATVPAYSNPSAPTVVNGNVRISEQAASTVVTASDGSIINWKDFSIAPGEVTRFIQGGADSRVLNRVTGIGRSVIDGQLLADGRVFLINPNGVLVGGGAVVNTGGLVVSSLGISNEDFAAGRMNFSGSDSGSVVNRGVIRTTSGGDVVLVASSVKNTGVIQSDGGNLVLAAGESVTLSSLDVDHMTFEVTASSGEALNLGKMISTGGAIGLFASRVASAGTLSATRVSADSDGTIRLVGSESANVSGRLDVTGSGTVGGTVDITASEVALRGAAIEASGSHGGVVRIGGDYQGRGELANANRVEVDVATTVSANALSSGDGGKIIVWSDHASSVDGRLAARGGVDGGNGGFIETSSAGQLSFSSPADVSAPAGQGGTWLLDPEDIFIGADEADHISTALNTGSNVAIKTADAGTGEGNIHVNAAITKTDGPDASLTLDAHNDINVNKSITSTHGALDVTLISGGDVAIDADIATNGGSLATRIAPAPVTDLEPAEVLVDSVDHTGDKPTAEDESLESEIDSGEDLAGQQVNDALDAADSIVTGGDVLITSSLNTDGGEIILEGNRVEFLGLIQDRDLIVTTGAGSISVNANEEFRLTSLGQANVHIETGGDMNVVAESMQIKAGTAGGDVIVNVGDTFTADLEDLFVMDSRIGATSQTRIRSNDVKLRANTVTLINPKGPNKGTSITAQKDILVSAERLLISNRNDDVSIESLDGRIRLQNLAECVNCNAHIKGTMSAAANEEADRDDPFANQNQNNPVITDINTDGNTDQSGGTTDNSSPTDVTVTDADDVDEALDTDSELDVEEEALLADSLSENPDEILLSLLDTVDEDTALTPAEKKARRNARRAKRAAKREQESAKSARSKSSAIGQCR